MGALLWWSRRPSPQPGWTEAAGGLGGAELTGWPGAGMAAGWTAARLWAPAAGELPRRPERGPPAPVGRLASPPPQIKPLTSAAAPSSTGQAAIRPPLPAPSCPFLVTWGTTEDQGERQAIRGPRGCAPHWAVSRGSSTHPGSARGDLSARLLLADTHHSWHQDRAATSAWSCGVGVALRSAF